VTTGAPRRRIAAIMLWLAFLAGCLLIISRTHFTTDLSAFLPRTPTPEQQLHHFTGRVARQQCLDHQACGRSQQLDAVAQGRTQALLAEAFRRHGRAQYITVRQQEGPIAFAVDGLAIRHAGKCRVAAQLLGDLF
jgi:predicted exporter